MQTTQVGSTAVSTALVRYYDEPLTSKIAWDREEEGGGNENGKRWPSITNVELGFSFIAPL